AKIPNPIAELEALAYVSNLYVRPSARGGTGTRLLETALDWARANRIDRVFLWPPRRRVTSYRGPGFAPHGADTAPTTRSVGSRGVPVGARGDPSNTSPARRSCGPAAATCVAIRPPIDLPPMNSARRADSRLVYTASMTAR